MIKDPDLFLEYEKSNNSNLDNKNKFGNVDNIFKEFVRTCVENNINKNGLLRWAFYNYIGRSLDVVDDLIKSKYSELFPQWAIVYDDISEGFNNSDVLDNFVEFYNENLKSKKLLQVKPLITYVDAVRSNFDYIFLSLIWSSAVRSGVLIGHNAEDVLNNFVSWIK